MDRLVERRRAGNAQADGPRPPQSVVALVPARSGSKRVADKNVRLLGEHPLIAYTIAAARASGIFTAVVVSTDSERYAEIARHYGALVPALRPPELAGDRSPDIEWVEHMLSVLDSGGERSDCFSILRPTSPFRLAATIRRAWRSFCQAGQVGWADSLRAVEACSQHPGKMWVRHGDRILPLLPLQADDGRPWHSSQYAALPQVLVQNASLEIAWWRVVAEQRSIAGTSVVPFITEGHEGLDVNQERDWLVAELLVRRGIAPLPPVDREPWPAAASPARSGER